MVAEKQISKGDSTDGEALPRIESSPLVERVSLHGVEAHGQTLPVKSRVIPAQPIELPRAWVTILPELCKGCEMCVHACPSGNLEMSEGLNRNGYHPVVFNYQGRNGPCSACGICHVVCPDYAISKVWKVRKQ